MKIPGISFGTVFAILLIIYFVAYKKNSDGDNLFAVFGTAATIQDFCLDMIFIRNVYKNMPKIFIPRYVNNIN